MIVHTMICIVDQLGIYTQHVTVTNMVYKSALTPNPGPFGGSVSEVSPVIGSAA